MHPYQQQFIEFAIEKKVLRFGEFRLKSGRTSPYFFNSGLFNDGESLNRLGNFYAEAILSSQIDFDMLFGPAYKGIPLVSALAIALHRNYQRSVPYCFNRKEPKDHGEGGITLGAPLKDRVLIVDDVITAGTSIRESIRLIEEAGAHATAVIVALDRQERGTGRKSAIQEIEQTCRLPVISIISLDALIEYLGNTRSLGLYLDKIHDYRDKYGTTN